jgi:hypothetical protein
VASTESTRWSGEEVHQANRAVEGGATAEVGRSLLRGLGWMLSLRVQYLKWSSNDSR